jgi:lipopolysaccharide export system protein LptA
MRRLLFLLLALFLGASILAQESSARTAEIIRKKNNKKVVAQVKSDEGVFYIDYGDIAVGKVKALSGNLLTLEDGKTYWLDKESRLLRNRTPVTRDELKPGAWVEVAYNKDNTDKEDHPYGMRLLLLDKAPEAKADEEKSYARIVLSDQAPNRVSVKFGEDATAYGPLALVEKGVEEFVRLSDGSAAVDENTLALTLSSKSTPGSVEVDQGKSKAFGSTLEYDNESGEANLAGPIKLERQGEKPLTGESKTLTYNVDDETLLLQGDLKLVQGDRTTTAQSAIVREKEGLAFLFGNPVKSVSKDGTVQGKKVRYTLERGDIVVLEGVSGEFQDQ